MTRFSKYHGLGNDFVVVDLREASTKTVAELTDPKEVARVCQRRFGVGADGILAILPGTSVGAYAQMLVLNADGSQAEMCGNGIRCVAKHLYERDRLSSAAIAIDTGAGQLVCELTVDNGAVSAVRVDMGAPKWSRPDIPLRGGGDFIEQNVEVSGVAWPFTAVSMGNPHVIAFVEEAGDALMTLATTHGPNIEVSPLFPNRTNVEFARVISPSEIDLVVWERGSGITQACGTGACATVVAACLTKRCQPGGAVTVHLPGGDLVIEVAKAFGSVHMTGPTTHVFDGELA